MSLQRYNAKFFASRNSKSREYRAVLSDDTLKGLLIKRPGLNGRIPTYKHIYDVVVQFDMLLSFLFYTSNLHTQSWLRSNTLICVAKALPKLINNRS
jgi:hypothetical protein